MMDNQAIAHMTGNLTDWDWGHLMEQIEAGKCTPFLGAGVNAGLLPLGGQIARDWATTYQFPLRDPYDLARVAQYLALTKARVLPKTLIQEMFHKKIKDLFSSNTPPNFIAPNHPLGVLAALPLPIYITTNYDDFMFRSLIANHKKARVEVCAWYNYLKEKASVTYPDLNFYTPPVPPLDDFSFGESAFNSMPVFKPKADNRVVYHLHGHYSMVESMLLTENDYWDFLVHMSKDPKLLPNQITTALTGSSLLFMGYSLADPNFRVLFRGLLHPMAENRRLSVSIQLRPSDLAQPDEERALDFLMRYFGDLNIKVFFGTAEEFAAELWRRWNNRQKPEN